jgi:hypothetical protein
MGRVQDRKSGRIGLANPRGCRVLFDGPARHAANSFRERRQQLGIGTSAQTSPSRDRRTSRRVHSGTGGNCRECILLDPRLADTPYWQSSIYETRVMLAVKSMGAVVSTQNTDISSSDLVVRWRAGEEVSSFITNRIGKMVEISLRYLGEGQKLKVLDVPRREGKAGEYAVPLIVVTNAPISAALEDKIADGDIGIADAVTWNVESDNSSLVKAIKRAVDLPE